MDDDALLLGSHDIEVESNVDVDESVYGAVVLFVNFELVFF